MAGWWRRDAFFIRYLLREATAVFVAAYALVLLAGLVRLSQGEAAFEGYLELLRTPASIAAHGVLFAAFAYHTVSWFSIMPKTLPPVVVGGRRLAPGAITTLGIAAALAASVLLVVALRAVAG